jgi:hypothetical protein
MSTVKPMDGEEPWYDELVSLGMTGYEARAYLALIGRDRSTAAQLARDSGVPRQRIYDVLATLTERGLARPLHGQVTRYTAVDPASAIERLMAAHRVAFSRLEQTTASLVEALVPVWSHGRSEGDPLDYVEVIRDQDVLLERFEEIQVGARRELLNIAKMPYVTQNPVGAENTRRIVSGGGRVRCIYERAALGDSGFANELTAFATAGESARIAVNVPIRLVIADGTRVLMSLRDPVPEGTSTNILIEHAALATCLTLAFETVWGTAVPLEEIDATPTPA